MSADPRSLAASRNSGRQAVIMRLVPRTLTSNISRQSSMLASSTDSVPRAMPALLTSVSIPPRSPICETTRATSSSRVVSATIGSTRCCLAKWPRRSSLLATA